MILVVKQTPALDKSVRVLSQKNGGYLNEAVGGGCEGKRKVR